MYHVFNLKLFGWWGKGSTWGDLKNAKAFTRDEAIAFCKARFVGPNEELGAMPVSLEDIEAVKK